MLLILHLLGAAVFVTTVVGSAYGLVRNKNKTIWANALLGASGVEIISGVLLLFTGTAAIGRVCLMSLVVLAIAYPLRIRLLRTA